MLPASHQGEVAFGDANFHLRTSLGGGDNHDETRPHIAFLLAKPTCFGQTQTARVHRHYIAADAVDWDLCPGRCQPDMKVEGLLNSIHRTGTAQNWNRCRKAQMETADMVPDNPGFGCSLPHRRLHGSRDVGAEQIGAVQSRAAKTGGRDDCTLPYETFVQNSIPRRFVL
jgi:hypothetical protein